MNNVYIYAPFDTRADEGREKTKLEPLLAMK